MAIEWEQISKKRDELTNGLLKEGLSPDKRLLIQKELSKVSSLLDAYKDLSEIESKLEQAKIQLASNTDAEMAELFEEEIGELEAERKEAKTVLDDLMFPPDKHDNRSVYLEIRSGAGGQEAALFAADLMKMYTQYALTKNWKVDVQSLNETDLGGLREVILHIKGKGVYGHLKHESGVHRVQRVPQTETQGRIHTSTATIAVLPEAKAVDLTISPADLRIDVYRASGAGGQHVNTTDSAVRITHIPTGVVVTCQDERSQHKNKAKAMKVLQSRLLLAQKKKEEKEMSKQRKSQIGTGMRSEKVRTYNYPQNRVTDHQVGLTLKKLDMVMTGALDEIVDALREKDRQTRKEEQLSSLGSS